MNQLERRLQALETRAGLGADRVDVIIRRMVAASPTGPVMSEPRAVVSLPTGWRLDRDPGEEAAAFLERARRLVPRISPGAVASLLEVR